jgi:redox-sensitive bicupin YhaK (pirin superfamily)
MQMAQIWVNLPRAHKMDEPHYQPITARDIRAVELADGGGSVRVIAGEYQGVHGPARTYTPIQMLDARLNGGGRADFAIPAGHNAAILVMKGEVTLNGQAAKSNDFVLFANEGERVAAVAGTEAQLLLLAGQPIDEPVVSYGPFVMNSVREIQQAITDFNMGKFGELAE